MMSCEIASAAAGHPGGGASLHTLCRLSPLLPVLVLIRHVESGRWEGAVLLLVGFIAFLHHAYMHISFSCQSDLGPQVELGKHVGPKLEPVCGERCFGQRRSQPQLTLSNRNLADDMGLCIQLSKWKTCYRAPIQSAAQSLF